MAVSYLHHHFGESFRTVDIPFVQQLDPTKTEFLVRMIQHRVNSPLTSSCGRLFDAVAALLGVRNIVSYEGQAAIQLENLISGNDEQEYPLIAEDRVIKTASLFEAMVRDLRHDVPIGGISQRFHNGLVAVFANIAVRLRELTGIEQVCFSGGSFQNTYLSENLRQRLQNTGFRVFTQSEVPCNDGGLSLGQAVIAAHQDDIN
jgi:hydrogenase maturation protein HypF